MSKVFATGDWRSLTNKRTIESPSLTIPTTMPETVSPPAIDKLRPQSAIVDITEMLLSAALAGARMSYRAWHRCEFLAWSSSAETLMSNSGEFTAVSRTLPEAPTKQVVDRESGIA